jgi:hypothetical protein
MSGDAAAEPARLLTPSDFVAARNRQNDINEAIFELRLMVQLERAPSLPVGRVGQIAGRYRISK